MTDVPDALWSEIDANNSATPPAGWPEGMQPSDVNNSARANMGGVKRWYDRSNSTQTTTGTNTAYVLTYSAAQSAIYNGFEYSFILHIDNGAAATLNPDGLGARPLRRYDFATKAFVALGGSEFFANQELRVRTNTTDNTYDIISASQWSGSFVTLAGNNIFTGINQFDGTVVMSGAAINEAEASLVVQPTLPIGAAPGNTINVSGGSSSTVAISIASPAVITWNGNNLPNGAIVVFSTTGALPTGLAINTQYFVVNAAANTFSVATTSGGTAINTSGTQSGTHTATASNIVVKFDTIQAGVRRVLVAASAILLTSGSFIVLPGSGSITMATGDAAEFESQGGGIWRCVSYTRATGLALVQPTGSLINRAYVDNVNFTTITANIPIDDTIPQVGEGTEILSVAITPKTTTDRVRVRAVVPLGLPSGASGVGCVALFRNGGANAISAVFPRLVDGNGTYPTPLEFEDSPGSTSAQTYSIRVGGPNFNVLLNGDISGRLGGGVSRATLVLEEIVA